MVSTRMDELEWLRNQLEADGNDLLREMVRSFAQGLMSAEADVVCGAAWGQQSPDRVNRRNGYRTRRWDTRVGSIELRIPKLRRGSYFPEWLLDARTRSERAFVQVVTEAYVRGVSTRKVEGLVETLGVTSLSKSQVSELARELDQTVAEFRNRPLDTGPYTYAWADALVVKCREGGRVVNVALLVAVGINNEGHREILGLDVATGEDGAAWLAFWRSLIARGLSGVQLVTSDDHTGLRDAIAATLPGVSWQRCRTHYLRNLLTKVPRSAETMMDHHGPNHLRPTRPRIGLGAAPAGGRPPSRPRHGHRSRPPRPGRRRDTRLHRLPQGELATDLVQQPPRTTQQRNTAPHQRRGHLPHPPLHHPPRRRPLGRTTVRSRQRV